MSRDDIRADWDDQFPVRRMTDEEMLEVIPAIMATRCPHCGMPLIDGICHDCFPPRAPSRQALVSQAVLNCLASMTPVTVALEGPAGTLRTIRVLWEGWAEDDLSMFLQGVKREYAKLVTP